MPELRTKSAAEKVAHVNRLFSQIAPRYDRMNRILSLGLDLSWRRKAIRQAGFAPGSRILDLGIGTGDFACAALRQIPECRVVGVDPCADLIRRGRAKPELRHAGAALQWVMGLGGSLPFADRSFDGVVAGFSIRNMPDFDQALAEMYRVLAPSGKAVLLDMVRPNGLICRNLYQLHFTQITPRLGRWFGSDPEAYAYLYHSIENFYTAAEMEAALKRHGFKNILLSKLMFQTVAIAIGAK